MERTCNCHTELQREEFTSDPTNLPTLSIAKKSKKNARKSCSVSRSAWDSRWICQTTRLFRNRAVAEHPAALVWTAWRKLTKIVTRLPTVRSVKDEMTVWRQQRARRHVRDGNMTSHILKTPRTEPNNCQLQLDKNAKARQPATCQLSATLVSLETLQAQSSWLSRTLPRRFMTTPTRKRQQVRGVAHTLQPSQFCWDTTYGYFA